MRTRLILVLSIMLTATGGCRNGQQSAQQSVVDKVKSSHRLHAAYVVYPPFVEKDANTGRLSGYFIDLMNEIASQGDFTVDYEEANWGSMVAGLESNRYDVVVSGIFPTIPRSFSAAFARPIMYIGLSAVVPKNDKHQWTVEDLQKPGLRVAVVNGEVGDEYAQRNLPHAKLIVLDTADIARAAVEVQQGRADVAIAAGNTLVDFAAKNPEVRPIFVDKPLQVFGCTLMIRRGDPDWLNFLNTSIDQLEASGELQRLEKKYKSTPTLWLDHTLPWQQQ